MDYRKALLSTKESRAVEEALIKESWATQEALIFQELEAKNNLHKLPCGRSSLEIEQYSDNHQQQKFAI